MADWQQIKATFHQAVDLPPAARSAFLDDACAGDASLRQEVEELLAHEKEEGYTFSGPARPDACDDAPLVIAHYRILGKLGEGGMGAVYRATDTKLDREVAIKVLPPSFAGDSARVARFTREAKVLAALNHPNIAQIYGIEENALVMELVPGETLQRPLPVTTALDYARQIAEALEAAHEKGIVHRDLKPANVVVTPEGVVKLLDFGLAAVANGSPDAGVITRQTVQPGVIIGTAAYMSPEQAAGKPVDKRADIWSFGVVLWETLTGSRMFAGETVSQTLDQVLRAPIEFGKLPVETPESIRSLLRRCLERNVKDRLRDIGEARIAIAAALAGETPAAARNRRAWLGWCVAALAMAGLSLLAFAHLQEKKAAPATLLRFHIPAPEHSDRPLSLSPDGRNLAFIAGGRLWVHSLVSGESLDLGEPCNGRPFWSPDSRFIAYPTEGGLKKIPATGGPAQTILARRGSGYWKGGSWGKDDVIVFGDRPTGLFRVSAAGGDAVEVTALNPARHERSQFCPEFLPDGRHFLYVRDSTDASNTAIYIGSVDAKPEQQSLRPLVAANSQAMYVASRERGVGYLLYVREGTLMAQKFDPRRFELKGPSEPLVEHLRPNDPGTAFVPFSASDNDVLAYAQLAASDMRLTWYDRQGRPGGTIGDPSRYPYVAFSPDGTRLAVLRASRADSRFVWLIDFNRGGAGTRLTLGPENHATPVWAPDGKSVIFGSNQDGVFNLYQKPASGVQDAVPLLKTGEDKFPTSCSPDGRFLLYTAIDAQNRGSVWVLPLKGGGEPAPFEKNESSEQQARFSPDGHWVAYTSDETGQDEVYVRPFSRNSSGGKFPISNGPGSNPHWRDDGRELYYQSHGGKIMAVAITTQPAFLAGKPEALGVEALGPWDSSPNGKRFVMPVIQAGRMPYEVVLNWQAGLQK